MQQQQQPQQHTMQNKPQQAPMQQGNMSRSPYSSMAIPTNNNGMNSGASKGVKTLPSIKENYSTGIKLQEVNGANGRQLQVDTCSSVL
jgi:hypothetical protein